MREETLIKLAGALPPIMWACLAIYLVFLLRAELRRAVGQIGNIEGFGIKLSLSGGQALNAAVEMARKYPGADVEVPPADRKRALDRAVRERALLDGSELLWVDDNPSNNRNEARMLRSFGAVVTFAVSTTEALRALSAAAEQLQPFHLILSDISRGDPVDGKPAGLHMLQELRDQRIFLPVVFYVARQDGSGVPAGALGLTNRPDELLQLVLDGLARTRG
jgi:CheY-like chemotaxis protein